MHRKSTAGLHRKPRATRAIATRTAVYAGAAVMTVGFSASAATAAPAATDELPAPPAFCTGTFFDAFTSCYASTGSGNGGDGTGSDTPVLGGNGGE